MVYGIIDSKNHKYYTYLSNIFRTINNAQNHYNWLITDCECCPHTPQFEQLLGGEYCWLTGEELSAMIAEDDFQWIWAVIAGFEKDIPLSDVLKYPLPSAQDYDGYYKHPVHLQHPLASIEIVPSDSSWTLILSKNKDIVEDYLTAYPQCQELGR